MSNPGCTPNTRIALILRLDNLKSSLPSALDAEVENRVELKCLASGDGAVGTHDMLKFGGGLSINGLHQYLREVAAGQAEILRHLNHVRVRHGQKLALVFADHVIILGNPEAGIMQALRERED